MNYISTRDTAQNPNRLSSAEAIKMGLAPDGGLFIPEEIPMLNETDLARLSTLSYAERAAFILGLFLPDYDGELLRTAGGYR